MVVNYEFLGTEPIENVITCMHYKIDKVVFFGYKSTIDRYKVGTNKFLRKFCGVKDTEYHVLSTKDLQSCYTTMKREIEQEISAGGQVYFDITGGESLILVAFGMLAKEYNLSVHQFNVEKNKIIELKNNSEKTLSKDVEKYKFDYTIDMLVEMRGGKINYKLHKDSKERLDSNYVIEIERLWKVAKKYSDSWIAFSSFMKKVFNTEGLTVSRRAVEVINEINDRKTPLSDIKILNRMLDSLQEEEILSGVLHENGKYQMKFSSERVRNLIYEGGSILEMHTYLERVDNCDDCKVGVHLDWDGIVHSKIGEDVLNEIDVLCLDGNIPTFISCKMGNMESNSALHALYELQTVADRFGGKYAKKILISARPLGDVYMERAIEMGIEVR